MSIVTMDFETRSAVDIKTHGAYVYASDLSTEVLCLAVKWNDDSTNIWVPKTWRTPGVEREFAGYLIDDEELQDMVDEADELHAHNATFEYLIWEHIMSRELSFKEQPLERWYCSAATAAACGLPRSLSDVGNALNLPIQKDADGRRVMLRMCRPRNLKKTDSPDKLEWHEEERDFVKLFRYCIRDVDTEHLIEKCLPPLSRKERAIWLLDQKINENGFHVRVGVAKQIIQALADYEKTLLQEIEGITDGAVFSPRQVSASRQWLKERGIDLPDLTKSTVLTTLARTDLPENVRRFLEIRQDMGKSSTAKYNAAIQRANEDERIRGSFLYCGAATGRWAGRGFQPQNLPRPEKRFDPEKIEELIPELTTMKPEVFASKYGSPMKFASSAIRSMIAAPEGFDLVCADFSSIEARVLAWLAGDVDILDAFWVGEDVYLRAASAIYGLPVEKINSEQRFIGKVATLALGYGGGVKAFQAMAKGYGVTVAEEEAQGIVTKWRASHPPVVAFWSGVEAAAKEAILHPDVGTRYGRIMFAKRDDVLYVRLPSGRKLWYWIPNIEECETPWGAKKETITYFGVNSTTRKWERLRTYGGKLTENIVQAVARDLLAEAMVRLDQMGFDITAHVHDEVLAEIPEDNEEEILAVFCYCMTADTSWSKGLPLEAQGWRAKTYRK